MNLNDILAPIVKFLQWTFEGLVFLGNLPNKLFIMVGFIALGSWLFMQYRYNQQKDRDSKFL
jgi:hypothetical protein